MWSFLQAKFFERIKIERKIEKAKREVAAKNNTPEAIAAAVRMLAEQEEDLQVISVLQSSSVHHMPSLFFFDSPPEHGAPPPLPTAVTGSCSVAHRWKYLKARLRCNIMLHRASAFLICSEGMISSRATPAPCSFLVYLLVAVRHALPKGGKVCFPPQGRSHARSTGPAGCGEIKAEGAGAPPGG
jgi:hypothetical protein